SDPLALIEIIGPKGRDAAVASVGGYAPELDELRFAQHGNVMVGRVARAGADSYTILAPRDEAEGAIARLCKIDGEIREVPQAAVEVIRVENGIARVGVDTHERTLALEARLDRAISSTKGCYVGQETIERVNSRGGLKRRLHGLRVVGSRAPRENSIIALDGKEVGRVGSSAISPRLGALALSILHHSAWQPGTRVVIRDQEGDSNATVSDLPFAANAK
ncbi:MAG: YgfZ/GcvT domain-containing protein, partial [Candidatus Binataceae bacterium]